MQRNGNIKGVAPQAEIYAYRALGPGGAGTSESVILAIEKAIQDDVDIINLSLGNDVNGPDLPTSLALDRAVEKGIVTVTSSGNSGQAYGPWALQVQREKLFRLALLFPRQQFNF